MTVSEGRRMHTKSLRRIINLLKGRPNIKKVFVWANHLKKTVRSMTRLHQFFSYIVLSIGTLNCALSFKGKMTVPKVKAYLTHTLYMGQLLKPFL